MMSTDRPRIVPSVSIEITSPPEIEEEPLPNAVNRLRAEQEEPEGGFRTRLGSWKQLMKIVTPKSHRRRSHHQGEAPALAKNEVETTPKITRKKRHSLAGLLDDTEFVDMRGQETDFLSQSAHHKKTSLLSSLVSVIHPDHGPSRAKSSTELSHHRRQSSDSLIVDGFKLKNSDIDHKQEQTTPRLIKHQHEKKLSKKLLMILDSNGGPEGLLSTLMGYKWAEEHEFEVQRLELSEVHDEIARLKHAESQELIHQVDDKSTLSRIEKLFPNDDLELVSSTSKKSRRRRSAPSQSLLKNFKRGSPIGVESPTPTSQDLVSRKFIFESPVQLTTGVQTQERYLFLFNDLLFIAKQRSATSYKLKKRVVISEMWVTGNVSEVSETSVQDRSRSFVIGWPTTNFIATFTTQELCERWKTRLAQLIEEEQSKEQEHIEVKVNHKSNGSQHDCALLVGKQTDAKDLLRTAMSQFDIEPSREGDYGLWLRSSREDSAYPLFGHEQTYAIQSSHDREASETNPNADCTFILKEAKKPTGKIDRKQSRSRKAKLAQIFKRSTGKLPTSPQSHSLTEGKLFGHPLPSICEPEFPVTLLELLERLYNIGPYTTEIFRKPSNAKKCAEMVAHLNSEKPDGWAEGCNNGFLYASILKTFLKELPGKLCGQELYNQWADTAKLTDDTAKIEQCRCLVNQLPICNQKLLKYIICILTHIQSKSEENLMTSYNLAVCLGPSLLWVDSDLVHDQESASRTVPIIIQFIIDNCKAILGDDIQDMFGHPPVGPEDSDSETDRMNTPDNDSMESLSDNEPSMGALQQMSPSSCSRDSGLILSDPHEDAGEQSDEMSLRQQQLIKSKSCDSLAVSSNSRRHSTTLATLQSQVSSDSLDCDDEYVEIGTSFNSGNDSLLLTKSSSGAHLCFNQQAGLRNNLNALAARYAEGSPSLPEVGYTSSDSDKSDFKHRQGRRSSESASPRYTRMMTATFYGADLNPVQKSSTNSSLGHRGSTSSDDAVPAVSYDRVTYRHIDDPKFHESESGFHPTDLLQQFKRKQQTEDQKKKQVQDILRERTTPEHSLSAADILQSSTTPLNANYQHSTTFTPRSRNNEQKISRTNTYGGRSERRARLSQDTNVPANMAETAPILPQQYRPNKPPTYQEAVERKNSKIPESERMKQTVNSARAKQLYSRSVQQFEREQQIESPRDMGSSTTTSDEDSMHIDNPTHATRYNNNNNTIVQGVIKTGNTKIVFKRAPGPVKSASLDRSAQLVSPTNGSMFFQPGVPQPTKITSNISGGSSFANSFYRPSQPPPYKEVMRRRSKPDIIDDMEESLV